MSSKSSDGEPRRASRRSFLQSSAGVATGVAMTATPAAAVIALTPGGAFAASPAVPMEPASAVPSEPVTAFLRNAASGEVTVLSGTVERTYRDPVLAKRLMDAARSQDPNQTEAK